MLQARHGGGGTGSAEGEAQAGCQAGRQQTDTVRGRAPLERAADGHGAHGQACGQAEAP